MEGSGRDTRKRRREVKEEPLEQEVDVPQVKPKRRRAGPSSVEVKVTQSPARQKTRRNVINRSVKLEATSFLAGEDCAEGTSGDYPAEVKSELSLDLEKDSSQEKLIQEQAEKIRTLMKQLEETKSTLGRVDERVVKLFPEVVKVYWSKFAVYQNNSKELVNLNVRLVCKAWRDGLDKLLLQKWPKTQNDKLKLKLLHETIGGHLPRGKPWNEFPFYQSSDLFVLEEDKDNEGLSQSLVRKLLTKCGHKFTNFYFSTNVHHYGSLLGCYSVTSTWLTLMPNLEGLTLDYVLEKTPVEHQQEVAALEKALQKHPFPKLKSLEELTFWNSSSGILLQAALTSNPHVQSIQVMLPINLYPVTLVSLENLKKLEKLEIHIPDSETLACVASCETLKNLKAPNLQIFAVKLESPHLSMWGSVLDVLRVFRGTITGFVLRVSSGSKVMPPACLEMPKLRALKLSFDSRDSYCTEREIIGFVSSLKMDSLEHLNLQGLVIPDKDADKRVKSTERLAKELLKFLPSLMTMVISRFYSEHSEQQQRWSDKDFYYSPIGVASSTIVRFDFLVFRGL